MRARISDVLPFLPYLQAFITHETPKITDIMSSAMITQTLQGAVLSMTSNVLAQAISSFKDSVWRAMNLLTND
jgi:hypothetical protein